MTEVLSSTHAEWLRTARGLTRDTLQGFGLTSEGETLRIPYSSSVSKYRKGIPNGDRKFWFSKGHTPGLFNQGEAYSQYVILCEGETDTMRLWQELREDNVENIGVVGLSGIDTWDDEMANAFTQAERVFVCLDRDADYNVAARVDGAWFKIRKAIGPKAKRIELPEGVKDLCEFFDNYNLDAFRELIKTTPVLKTRFKPLDFTGPEPELNWFLDEIIHTGDVGLLMGEPGIGKSWISMGLAVAVAQNQRVYLGRKLNYPENSKVLIVDEENPSLLVRRRLRQLGLDDEGASRMRYLSHQGVRLDRHPDWLLEEAAAFEPALIVLDSLTRFHSKEENNAGEMSKLYNDGIKPLAKEVGATVIVLHHVNKSQGGSSFQRQRGSGDISAAVDTALDVFPSDNHRGLPSLNLVTFKTRWQRPRKPLRIQVWDVDEHRREVVEVNEPEAPF